MPSMARYYIHIGVALSGADAAWFEDLYCCPGPAGGMVLCTPAIDQTALHGILATLRDLAIPLLAVQQVDPPGDGRAAKGTGTDV
ncbi:MAG TPA: hypothetical protein VM536_06260 [Chloroflexia bacterium]|nr:hypothetical protein [Chloroflexia bacterium]